MTFFKSRISTKTSKDNSILIRICHKLHRSAFSNPVITPSDIKDFLNLIIHDCAFTFLMSLRNHKLG